MGLSFEINFSIQCYIFLFLVTLNVKDPSSSVSPTITVSDSLSVVHAISADEGGESGDRSGEDTDDDYEMSQSKTSGFITSSVSLSSSEYVSFLMASSVRFSPSAGVLVTVSSSISLTTPTSTRTSSIVLPS